MTFDQYEEAIARVAVAAFVLGALLGAAAIVLVGQWQDYCNNLQTGGKPNRISDHEFLSWWREQRRSR